MKDAAAKGLGHSMMMVSQVLDYDPDTAFETLCHMVTAAREKCYLSNLAAKRMRWLPDPPQAGNGGYK